MMKLQGGVFMKKCIIIGGGPAGLTAGYELLKKSDEYEVMKPLVNATYLIQNKVTNSSFRQVPINEFINKE